MEENYLSALDKAREEFGAGDPVLMSDCSGAMFNEKDKGEGVFKLTYLNQDYLVTFPRGEISFADLEKDDIKEKAKSGCGRPYEGGQDIDYSGKTILISDQVLILYYLRYASGLPPRGRWINFLELPNGSHHYSCFIEDAINPMINKMAGYEKEFYQGVKALGGEKIDTGDFGAVIPVFPKISMAFVIWEGDDEFPPKGNILFDSVISTYLDTASVYVLGINASMRLINKGGLE